MPIYGNQGGAWKAATPWVKQGGAWKQATSSFGKQGGTWKSASLPYLFRRFKPSPSGGNAMRKSDANGWYVDFSTWGVGSAALISYPITISGKSKLRIKWRSNEYPTGTIASFELSSIEVEDFNGPSTGVRNWYTGNSFAITDTELDVAGLNGTYYIRVRAHNTNSDWSKAVQVYAVFLDGQQIFDAAAAPGWSVY